MVHLPFYYYIFSEICFANRLHFVLLQTQSTSSCVLDLLLNFSRDTQTFSILKSPFFLLLFLPFFTINQFCLRKERHSSWYVVPIKILDMQQRRRNSDSNVSLAIEKLNKYWSVWIKCILAFLADHQLGNGHWSQVTLSSVSTWEMRDCSIVVWVLLLTLKVG